MPLLLEAQTDHWKLEISGPDRELPSYLRIVETTVEGDIDIPSTLRVCKRSLSRMYDVQPVEVLDPVFFENTDYHLYFTAGEDAATLDLPPAARLICHSGSLSHYAINFRNDVGYFEIVVRGVAASSTLRFEVFPSKLDYRSDY